MFIQKIRGWRKSLAIFKNPLKVFLLWKKLERNVSLIETKSGLKFYVRPGISDIQMIKEVFYDEYYNRALSMMKNKEIVIDIGANIGSFTLRAAKNPAVDLVYSFEPFPSNYELVERNIQLNKLENKIYLSQQGIGKKKEKRKLFLGLQGNATHSLFTKSNKSISINIIKLEDIFRENNLKRCSLLKMDCEGAEYEIFESATPALLKKINIICMEYHPNGNPQNIKLKLEKCGFDVLVRSSNEPGIGFIYAQNRLSKNLLSTHN